MLSEDFKKALREGKIEYAVRDGSKRKSMIELIRISEKRDGIKILENAENLKKAKGMLNQVEAKGMLLEVNSDKDYENRLAKRVKEIMKECEDNVRYK